MGEEVEEILSAAEREALRTFGHEMEPDGDETKLARRVLECPNTGNDGWYNASAVTLAAAYLSLRASLTRVEEERDEAVKALEPFARVGEVFEKTSDDLLVPWGTPDGTRVDLFRASAVTRDFITAGQMRKAHEVHTRLSRARGDEGQS